MADPTTEALTHSEGFLARINHPIFGAFAASWLVWNWEIPYTLIRGLGTPKETIAEINADYLNSGHLWNVLLLPLLMTTAFLVLGPILRDGYSTYREFIKVVWNWADMKVKGLQPLPRSQYTSLGNQLKQAQDEKNVYQRAYFASDNRRVKRTDGFGGENDLDQIFMQLDGQQKQVMEFQKENNRLQAELLTANNRLKELGLPIQSEETKGKK